MTAEMGSVYVVIAVAGFLATEPWRYLGVLLSHNLSADHEGLEWVRAVSTALIAGLVTRMVVFPTGALAHAPLWLRIDAFAIGIAAFLLLGRAMAIGIVAGVATLTLGLVLIG